MAIPLGYGRTVPVTDDQNLRLTLRLNVTPADPESL